MTRTIGIVGALTTVSMLALAVPAQAQEVQPPAETQAQPGATTSNTTAATADQAGIGPDQSDGGDIIVTATRRAQRLQDVPLAVNALTGDQLAQSGFQSLQDIQYQFSGVQFGTSPNDAGFRLRGVGSAGGFTSASEQNVGTVVDNVVVPFGNPVQSLGDLDRVEVLKGPQGTQFGKNASSGVVNITTRKPDLNNFGGTAFASYAELNERNLNASLNLPLGGNAALAVYGFDREYDGFVRNIVLNKDWGGVHAYGGRAKLLWEPSANFSAYLIGDWSRNKQTGPQQLWTLNRLAAPTTPVIAARFAAVTALGVVPGLKNEISVENTDGNLDERNYGGSLELNLKAGDYNITSITAYRKLDQRPKVYSIDALPQTIFTAREVGVDRSFASQEVRLTSPTGSTLEFVAGLYVSRLKAGYGDQFAAAQLRPAAPFAANPIVALTAGLGTTRTKTDSAAAFVDGSVRVSETFRILVGGRYSYDWVDAENFSVIDPLFPPGASAAGFVVPYTARPLVTGSVDRGDWSGRIGFEANPADNIMFYGTVARGYLGPTVTFSGLSATRTDVDPQTVVDITIGAKTQLFDRHLTLNGNIFFDDYKNLQTSVFNGQEFLTENAGGFQAAGFEVEATYRFSRRFSINANYTYSDTYFTDYVTLCPESIVALGAAATAAQCNAVGSTAASPLFQARGEPLSGAPKHSVTLGADFNQPLTDRLTLDASASYYYRSRVQYDPGELYARQPGYDLVGLNVGVGAPDGAWRIGAFARNLFDTRFQSSVISVPLATAGAVNWATRDGRRTIGGQVAIRF